MAKRGLCFQPAQLFGIKGLVLFGLGLVMEVADFKFCEWFKGF